MKALPFLLALLLTACLTQRPDAAQAQCDRFNREFPVGTYVKVIYDPHEKPRYGSIHHPAHVADGVAVTGLDTTGLYLVRVEHVTKAPVP